MKVLLIEDEEKVAGFIQKGLREDGFAVDVALTGHVGEQMASLNEYDVIILDVMLPGKSGFAVCKSIRSFLPNVPIIMLTALDSVDDKIEGFERGADDYMVKPFEFKELIVRLRALVRRSTLQKEHSGLNIITIADLTVNCLTKEVTRGGEIIRLTAREFALLQFLAQRKHRTVSKADIIESVWETQFDTSSNTIEVYINFLRRKIDKNFDPKLIRTVVGMGYVLTDKQI